MIGSLNAYRASKADLSNLSPAAARMAQALREAGIAPNIEIISGYRDVNRNAAVGGAKGSRHTRGDAIDVSTAGLTDDQRAALLRTAIASGARGIGIYPGGSLHFDVRETPAFWGVNGSYRGSSVDQAPAWARGELAPLFGNTAVARATTPRNVGGQTPQSVAPGSPPLPVEQAGAPPNLLAGGAPVIVESPLVSGIASLYGQRQEREKRMQDEDAARKQRLAAAFGVT